MKCCRCENEGVVFRIKNRNLPTQPYVEGEITFSRIDRHAQVSACEVHIAEAEGLKGKDRAEYFGITWHEN